MAKKILHNSESTKNGIIIKIWSLTHFLIMPNPAKNFTKIYSYVFQLSTVQTHGPKI